VDPLNVQYRTVIRCHAGEPITLFSVSPFSKVISSEVILLNLICNEDSDTNPHKLFNINNSILSININRKAELEIVSKQSVAIF
jgi:hypothetical protein